jgi:2'-5' RNA ligase
MSEYWIFLVPTVSQSVEYNRIIKSLSKKYKTPNIDAHVTVLGMLKTEEKELIKKVGEIAKGFKRIEVEVFGINFSNTVSQCVFAQIKMSPHLLSLYMELSTNLKSSDKSPYFPHMSLIYGNLPLEEKSSIASQVKLGNKLILDKLIIFRDGPLPNEWTNVAEFALN